MKHLTIVVPDGQISISGASCILGAYDIFTKANQFWKDSRGNELFEIQLAGVSKKVEFNNGLLTLKPQTNVSAISKTNLIIIPAMLNEKAINRNKLLADWIAKQYTNGAEISSMCTGAFMLASAGLLDGKNCSTHWSAVVSFKTIFPKVNLQIEKLITDENGIYTNGGGYSFLNLIIYLVEKYYDRQTAVYCSKVFQVELDRQSQSPFTIFTGQKSHQDEIIKQAQEYIETKLNEKISIQQLSSTFAVGRRSFDRRFIKATGNTPAEYWQRVKIEAAKKTFETTRKTIAEVMYDVGYSDVKKFRELFKKITGMLPLEDKSRYNKEAVI